MEVNIIDAIRKKIVYIDIEAIKFKNKVEQFTATVGRRFGYAVLLENFG